MSILFLCRPVTGMTLNEMRQSVLRQSLFQKHDLLLVFSFFMIGSACVLLGRVLVPWIVHEAEARSYVLLSLLPALIVLLSGSTVWGLYLIPAVAVFQGAVTTLSAYRSLDSASAADLLSYETISVTLTVPAFFLLAVLGLSSSSSLLYALRLSGKSAVRNATQSFIARWIAFAVLLLCFYLIHGTVNR